MKGEEDERPLQAAGGCASCLRGEGVLVLTSLLLRVEVNSKQPAPPPSSHSRRERGSELS